MDALALWKAGRKTAIITNGSSHLSLNADKWTFHEKPDDYALFLGRVAVRKGIDTLVEIARRMPDMPIYVHGPDNPSRWAAGVPPNLMFKGPIFGDTRIDVVRGHAAC